MIFTMKTAGMAVVLSLAAGSAFSKAHDQGVADGKFPESTSAVVESIEGPGVSRNFNKGRRGEAASGNGGDNRVEPVERPGQQSGRGNNEPD